MRATPLLPPAPQPRLASNRRVRRRASYYSAITTYARMTSGASYWPQSSASTAVLVQRGDYLPAATTFGVEVAKAGAALLLLYIGGIWLSSGVHAQ